MPAPSQLAIASSSLQRLAKEEASYHKELQIQQKSIEKLEKTQTEETDEDRGNQEFKLKQEDSHAGGEDEDVIKARRVLSETQPTTS